MADEVRYDRVVRCNTSCISPLLDGCSVCVREYAHLMGGQAPNMGCWCTTVSAYCSCAPPFCAVAYAYVLVCPSVTMHAIMSHRSCVCTSCAATNSCCRNQPTSTAPLRVAAGLHDSVHHRLQAGVCRRPLVCVSYAVHGIRISPGHRRVQDLHEQHHRCVSCVGSKSKL